MKNNQQTLIVIEEKVVFCEQLQLNDSAFGWNLSFKCNSSVQVLHVESTYTLFYLDFS